MKKRLLLTLVLALTLLGSMYVYASPASIYGDLVGIEEEKAYDLREETGKSFGQLAYEEGKLEEFKAAMLEERTIRVLEDVQSGRLTQEQADLIIENITDRIENCDPENPIGPRYGNGGCSYGEGYGNGRGYGGMMRGNGLGRGRGYRTY